MGQQTDKLEAAILRLLSEAPEISVRSIVDVAGLSGKYDANRKAIRRALNSLEEQDLIVPAGAGRSRVYVLKKAAATVESVDNEPYKGIEISTESQSLLQYISKDINEREPIGYNQDFLRSYKPNKTY